LSGESLRTNDDAMFHPDQAEWLARLYVGNADPYDPQLSPVFADFERLPPLLVHVGGDELLRDDARRIAAAARQAGVACALSEWRDIVHGWQLFPFFLPEARRSIDQASAFLFQAVGAEEVTADGDRRSRGSSAASR
jgi:monoterpene epsilon-lactone hydrolase